MGLCKDWPWRALLRDGNGRESFERSSCPLLSLLMGPGLGSLERGIKEEEGERGKAVGREEESQGEFP